MLNKIFSLDSPKAIKARKYGYLNAIHYMAPHTLAGVGNLCPKASAGCRALCLGEWSGQAGIVSNDADMNAARLSRREKARRFMHERADYMRDVVWSLEAVLRKAQREGLTPCVRMNGSSDIAWEGVSCVRNGDRFKNLMQAFPNVQFIDYTKIPQRMLRSLPSNYDLTFSRSETNDASANEVLEAGRNVAVVFAGSLPALWHGWRVIDGDKHDLRHVDIKGVVVGLSPKGRKAKHDTSGFVVR